MEEELFALLQIEKQHLCHKNINPLKCSAREYMEHFIFPTLLPGLLEMFAAAKQNQVFERNRTKFNACDFLTEYLYNNNPNEENRYKLGLWQIPFVNEINSKNPRPPIPLSLVWTDEEAALIIQAHWRAYLVRKNPEIQELRQYQKEMRETSYDIMFKVEEFWKKHQMEDVDVVDEDEALVELNNQDDTLQI